MKDILAEVTIPCDCGCKVKLHITAMGDQDVDLGLSEWHHKHKSRLGVYLQKKKVEEIIKALQEMITS